jgi:hypothetical protein
MPDQVDLSGCHRSDPWNRGGEDEIRNQLVRTPATPIEYENAQKRILEVFGQWKAPANFKIEFFAIRVGEWGGHVLVECDDPLTLHKFCSMLPAFVFEVHPVIRVEEAVRGELEVIAWRDGLKGK